MARDERTFSTDHLYKIGVKESDSDVGFDLTCTLAADFASSPLHMMDDARANEAVRTCDSVQYCNWLSNKIHTTVFQLIY